MGFLLRLFTGNPLSMLWIAGGIALASSVAGGAAAWKVQGWRLDAVKSEYAAFVSQVAATGHKAEAEKAIKEKTYAQDIHAAVTERDAALARLREFQADSGSSKLPRSPTAPEGSSQVCFGSEAYNAAFKRFGERYVEGLRGIVELAVEGDSAAIDAQALINSWPK